MTDDSNEIPLYPEPTIVVGLGRFGLSLLERLGSDWRWLSTSAGDDASLKNLRLMSVRPDADVDDKRWLRPEYELARVARAAGEDDLPTLAVHFAILRALGLIRYRHGSFQFGLPKDAGIVETADHQTTRRRRFFEWRTLAGDPLRAVERLQRMCADNPEIDLFVTPIVERVFHGQSPRLLLHLISRWRAFSQGRDPSPWSWIRDALEQAEAEGARRESQVVVEPQDSWLTDDDRAGVLDGVVPLPLPDRPRAVDADSVRGSAQAELPVIDYDAGDLTKNPLQLPSPFVPTARDLATPLSPRRLLRVDWETSGWVAEELDNAHSVEFRPVEASLFRLGFFDHDGSKNIDNGPLEEGLRELGEQVHRGLLRIWLDLQKEREESHRTDLGGRRRAGSEDCIAQCLEVLAGLVVKPFLEGDHPVTDRPGARTDSWVDGPELAGEPSSRLRETIVDRATSEAMPERHLLERLSALGLHFDKAELGQRPLFRDLVVGPGGLEEEARLIELRRAVNEETRHLVSFDHLKDYRHRPSRRPPRLTIYVVADVREPFSRRALRPVLRGLHQELMRAYGPLFDTSREGFDKPLSIVPIVWTPHPADAFGGDHPEANRIEEASILESLHDLRRWVEAVPASRRCIPQIFVNSRVTDTGVLGIEDAADQTRDFLTFQMRNDLSRDSWLRETAVGYSHDDLFSTFTCIEIDFPAERAREYLSNRFSREALTRLRQPGRKTEASRSEQPMESIVPPPEELLEPPRKRLSQITSGTARRLSAEVEDRLVVDAWTTAGEVHRRFDDEFEQHLFDRVHDSWMELTRNRGAMDDMVDQLRRETTAHLIETLSNSRSHADRLIEEQAGRGGLKTARAGFRRLRDESRTLLDQSEADRRRSQDLCLRHDLPDPSPIERVRGDVLEAADAKPDKRPMIVGLVLWAAMVPALGAPLAHSVARAFDLHLATGPVEFVLGPLGWLVGGLALFLPVYFLLKRHMREAVNRLRDAIAGLADAVRDVVEGQQGNLFGGSPSIRSFFAARLQMTAAVAGRNFADRIHDQISTDNRLAYRLFQSLEVQHQRLVHRAEALGVRPTSAIDDGERVDDDVSAIFSAEHDRDNLSLLPPERLVEYYLHRFPSLQEVDAVLPKFLELAGGFERWRQEACLSDTEALLEFGRREFSDLVTTPVGARSAFEDDVGQNLTQFVSRHFSNVGFGARFVGYEGFDADGLRRLAEAALVIHPELRPTFEKARRAAEAPATTETMDVIEAKILPNTAFILSLVQGINARSIQNLRRHETFFDRLELPDPATPWHGGPITLVGRRRQSEDDVEQRAEQIRTVETDGSEDPS